MRILRILLLTTCYVIVLNMVSLSILPGKVHANTDPRSPLVDETWVYLGGPMGGIGYDIRMHPENPDIMYVTDAYAGVSKSIDGGMNWFSSNEGIEARVGPSGDAIPVFSLTIDPHDPETLWIGLQNKRGIYKSTNGGETWSLKTNGIRERTISFRGFTVDPQDPNIVYAAGEIPSHEWAGESLSGFLFDKAKGVVYRTLDGGEFWEPIWSGESLARYVWVDPRDTNVIYISTGIFDREAANTDAENNIAGGVGIIKSIDGGSTWQFLGKDAGLTGLYVGSLFMHPENPDILLAGVGHDYWAPHNSDSDNGVFITLNQGENWMKRTHDGERISAVEFCLGDPSYAYATGENGFYRSEDGGMSWALVSGQEHGGPKWGPPGRYAGIPIDLQCDPRDPLRVFINSYNGGNLLSLDGGETWQLAARGFSGAAVQQLSIDSDRPWVVYATTLEGIARSTSAGFSWEFLNYGVLEGNGWLSGIEVNPFDPSEILLSGIVNDQIFRSTDGGFTWSLRYDDRSQQPVSGQTVPGFVDFTISPSNPEIMYAASRMHDQSDPSLGVYKSIDGGISWNSMNTGLPEDLNTNTIAIHPENSDIVWVGTVNDGVYKTIDGGQLWFKSSTGISDDDVRSLAVNPSSPDNVLAGTDTQAVYSSFDGGNIWQRSSFGLDPEASIASIVFDPSNTTNVWAADTNTGVSFSNNNGETWMHVNQGLDVRAVTSLAISSDGETLYAGTIGGGVFRLSTLNQDDFDRSAILAQPTPTITPVPEATSTKTPSPTHISTSTPISVAQADTSVGEGGGLIEEQDLSAPVEEINTVIYIGVGVGLIILLVVSGVIIIQRRKGDDG